MEESPTRVREIDSAFLKTRRWMRHLETKRKLAREQRVEFESGLYLWFHRFARRPNNEGRPAEAFRWNLMRVAYRGVKSFGVEVKRNSEDPGDGEGRA